MAYDDVIDNKQGAIKASEIFVDRQLDIIKNSIGETALKTLEGIMKPVADALRYNNMLLHSDGQIIWETNLGQPRIRFDADSKANNIRLRLMMLDESAQSRTVDIIIPATTGANSLTAFNTINMNNNELIYMELNRSVILAAVSGTPLTTPAEIVLENGIDGGSILTGQRLLKVSMTGSGGMPAMVADLDSVLQDSSQTVNIPIAARYDWTDGIDTFSDIWWIPHGIRWPIGSISVVGAVVVSGFNALPNYFVRTETELNQALTLLTNDGGIITPISSFTINSPVTIPANVKIWGRSNRADGTSNAKITVGSSAGFILNTGASLRNIALLVSTGFGALGAANVVSLDGEGASVEDCEIKLLSTTALNLGNTRCVRLNATKCHVARSYFFNSTTAGATAIYDQSGTDHLLLYNRVLNVTEHGYNTRAQSINVRSDYGMVPIGSIIPWLGASYLNGSNSTPSYLAGGSGVANLATYLGEGWTICDGRQLPTDSPLRTGGNIYTPNLTNLYLLGASTNGAVAGNNNYSTGNSNVPNASFNTNAVSVSLTGAALNAISQFVHQHNFQHTHRWGSVTGATGFTFKNINTAYNNGGMNDQWAGGFVNLTNNVSNISILATNNTQTFYTSGPLSSNGANVTLTGSSTVNYMNNSSSTLNGGGVSGNVNIDHSHTINSVFPTYMSVIYIMRVK